MIVEPRGHALVEEAREFDREVPDRDGAIRRLDGAEQELSWLFTGAAAEIGFSAQCLENGGGGLGWGAARIAALHFRMRTPARRRSAQKFRRIGLAAAAMLPEDFEVARLAYTPRRVESDVRARFVVRGHCLLKLCAA